MKVKPLQLDSAVEFWPWGYFKLEFSFVRRAVQIESVRPCSLFKSGRSGMKEIAKIASDRENNHTASKNTPCTKDKAFFIENFCENLSS